MPEPKLVRAKHTEAARGGELQLFAAGICAEPVGRTSTNVGEQDPGPDGADPVELGFLVFTRKHEAGDFLQGEQRRVPER